MGVDPDHVLMCEDGDRIELGDKGIKRLAGVPAGYLYVDGTVGDVGDGVLRDRKVLAEEGVVVVIVTVDMKTGAIIRGPRSSPAAGCTPPRPRTCSRMPPTPCAGHQGRGQEGGNIDSSSSSATSARRREVRQRPDQAPSDDRPGRHGGLDRACGTVAAPRRWASCTPWVRVLLVSGWRSLRLPPGRRSGRWLAGARNRPARVVARLPCRRRWGWVGVGRRPTVSVARR